MTVAPIPEISSISGISITEATVSTSEFIRDSSSPFWPMPDTPSYRAFNILSYKMARSRFSTLCTVTDCKNIPRVSNARKARTHSARKASCPVRSPALPPPAKSSTLLPMKAVSQVIRKLRHATMVVLTA